MTYFAHCAMMSVTALYQSNVSVPGAIDKWGAFAKRFVDATGAEVSSANLAKSHPQLFTGSHYFSGHSVSNMLQHASEGLHHCAEDIRHSVTDASHKLERSLSGSSKALLDRSPGTSPARASPTSSAVADARSVRLPADPSPTVTSASPAPTRPSPTQPDCGSKRKVLAPKESEPADSCPSTGRTRKRRGGGGSSSTIVSTTTT